MDELVPSKTAQSKANSANSLDAFGNCPTTGSEQFVPRIDFAVVFNFDDDEFEADEEVGKCEVREDKIIGVNGVEGDVTFAADLGIGAARGFEMDGERDDFLFFHWVCWVLTVITSKRSRAFGVSCSVQKRSTTYFFDTSDTRLRFRWFLTVY